MMRRDLEIGGGQQREGQGEGQDLLSQMIASLLREAETPPREVEGVSEAFCDGKSHHPSIHPSLSLWTTYLVRPTTNDRF